MGAMGTSYSDIQDAEDAKTFIFEPFKGLQSTSSMVSTAKRWLKHSAEVGLSKAQVYQLDPPTLHRFLLQVSAAGPTAASGVFRALSSFADKIGARFPFEHPSVAGYKWTRGDHTPAPAEELHPWEFFNIAANSLNGSSMAVTIDMLMLFIVIAVVRFKHVQRTDAQVYLQEDGTQSAQSGTP